MTNYNVLSYPVVYSIDSPCPIKFEAIPSDSTTSSRVQSVDLKEFDEFEDPRWPLIKKNIDYYLNVENTKKYINQIFEVNKSLHENLTNAGLVAPVFSSITCNKASNLFVSSLNCHSYENPSNKKLTRFVYKYFDVKIKELGDNIYPGVDQNTTINKVITLIAFNSFYPKWVYASKIYRIYFLEDGTLGLLGKDNLKSFDLIDVLTGHFYKKFQHSFPDLITKSLIADNKNQYKELLKHMNIVSALETPILYKDLINPEFKKIIKSYPANKVNGYLRVMGLSLIEPLTASHLSCSIERALSTIKTSLWPIQALSPTHTLKMINEADFIGQFLNNQHSAFITTASSKVFYPTVLVDSPKNQKTKISFAEPGVYYRFYLVNYIEYIKKQPLKKKIKMFVSLLEKLNSSSYLNLDSLPDVFNEFTIDDVTFKPLIKFNDISEHSRVQKNCMAGCWQHRIYFTNYSTYEVRYKDKLYSMSVDPNNRIYTLLGESNSRLIDNHDEYIQRIFDNNHEKFKSITQAKQEFITKRNQQYSYYLKPEDISYIYSRLIERYMNLLSVQDNEIDYENLANAACCIDKSYLKRESNYLSHKMIFNIMNCLGAKIDCNEYITFCFKNTSALSDITKIELDDLKINYEETNIGQYKALRHSSPIFTVYKIHQSQFLSKTF